MIKIIYMIHILKILTPLEYPMTHETQLNKKLQDNGINSPAPF